MTTTPERHATIDVGADAAISWALDPRDDLPPPNPLVCLTIDDVACALRRSAKSVYRRIDSGKLTAIREGGRYLVHPRSLRTYLRCL